MGIEPAPPALESRHSLSLLSTWSPSSYDSELGELGNRTAEDRTNFDKRIAGFLITKL